MANKFFLFKSIFDLTERKRQKGEKILIRISNLLNDLIDLISIEFLKQTISPNRNIWMKYDWDTLKKEKKKREKN